jgi:hypothetical protein
MNPEPTLSQPVNREERLRQAAAAAAQAAAASIDPATLSCRAGEMEALMEHLARLNRALLCEEVAEE